MSPANILECSPKPECDYFLNRAARALWSILLRGVAGDIPHLACGFRAGEFNRVFERFYPDVESEMFVPSVQDIESFEERRGEFDDLFNLLLDSATRPDEETAWMARGMAVACLGKNHLWQDMGLPHRKSLSELIRSCFGPLHEKNTGDMKWKKFFYKQICEREGFYLCKSPSCGACVDYNKCFGPEE
jgi:nitrogen fixation protein NifQ